MRIPRTLPKPALTELKGTVRSLAGGRDQAFSLVEIMVVVALLSMIVLGLMAMFSQVQRAFRLGMMQSDVLESGRMATDILAREIEQVTPSYQNSINFYAGIPLDGNGIPASSVQTLPGGTNRDNVRTNIQCQLFFTVRENQTWTGIGYFLRTNGSFGSGWGPVCSLYRFETNNHVANFRLNPFRLFNTFQTTPGPSTNISKLLDGVVHFRIRAYDTNGVWMAPNFETAASTAYWYQNNSNIVITPSLVLSEIQSYQFTNNAVPAYVEIEIGVLEKDTLARYQSIPNPAVQAAYLARHAGNVHLFRQRVAIRNVDRSAYQ
jgi:prepilin-type N-terminal cleavage/methylation domain-containing protein